MKKVGDQRNGGLGAEKSGDVLKPRAIRRKEWTTSLDDSTMDLLQKEAERRWC